MTLAHVAIGPVYPRAAMPGLEHVPHARAPSPALTLLVVASLFVGCPQRPSGPDIGRLPSLTSEDPAAESELRQARELAEHGDVEGAETRYRAFLDKRPDDPLVPLARLALGRILLERGDHAGAHAMFAEVALHPDPAIAEQGRFLGAVTHHALGRPKQAIATLEPMVGRTIDPRDTSLLLRTLADAMVATGDYAGAIRVLDELVASPLPEPDRKAARVRIEELVRTKAQPKEIDALYRDLPADGAAWPHVLKRAALDADAAGDTERVQDLLEEMRDHDVEVDDELTRIALRAERPSDANPQVVGAVLTLSGRARHVGELALRGLMLAADLPPAGPLPPDAPQLVFRDDGGDPARAVEAIEELVTVHRAIAIIGPLDARTADAAAERAQELGVPLLTLAPSERITEHGSMVFRIFPTHAAEIGALVAHARAQGAHRFAALLPEGPFGDATLDALTRVLATQTGELATAVRYPTAATSFREEAAAVAKAAPDALLVADQSAKVALLAPALAAAGVWSSHPAPAGGRSVHLLAPGVAFGADLARVAGRYLQGAVFSVPFDAGAATDAGRAFAERYQQKFGETPDAFAALAHDAYRLVRKAVETGTRTRADLAGALPIARVDALAGPSPGFGPSRTPLQPTRLVRLDGEAFVPAAAP